MRVLVADDEPDIRRVVGRALTAHGMQVDAVPDARAAVQQVRKQQYDVLLLDVLMPGTNGVDLIPTVLRIDPDLRVMMISAVNEPRTRVRCFELGAVDYVSKPFVLAELVARVRVHPRRAAAGPGVVERRRAERRGQGRRAEDRGVLHTAHETTSSERFLRTGSATLDLVARTVSADGVTIALSERESLVLTCLMRQMGDVCSREEVLRRVWGSDAASANVVDVYVGRLRAKLPPGTITTVRNAGYAFNTA